VFREETCSNVEFPECLFFFRCLFFWTGPRPGRRLSDFLRMWLSSYDRWSRVQHWTEWDQARYCGPVLVITSRIHCINPSSFIIFIRRNWSLVQTKTKSTKLTSTSFPFLTMLFDAYLPHSSLFCHPETPKIWRAQISEIRTGETNVHHTVDRGVWMWLWWTFLVRFVTILYLFSTVQSTWGWVRSTKKKKGFAVVKYFSPVLKSLWTILHCSTFRIFRSVGSWTLSCRW
jgi:hypothetical protein